MTRILPIAGALILATASAAAADTYRNDRFDLSAPVPEGFAAVERFDSEDGRTFVTADSAARLEIYGAPDIHGGLDRYRGVLKDLQPGSVTYEAGGESWFVLSGMSDEGIYYHRVESGRDCDGDPVFGHWRMTYSEAERSRFDALMSEFPEDLTVGCGAAG